MRLAFAALAILTTTCPAAAGDAAARRVIGFSPDGAYFAFEQYTMLYEDDASFSEYVVIDTRTDRFAPGTPVKVLIRGDDGLDEKKARADAAAKATPLLERLKIGERGTHIEGKASMDLDDGGIYQMDTKPLARSLAFALPDGRKATLSVARHPLQMATCEGYGGTGIAAKARGHGLKLTLAVAGQPAIVMQDDKALPKSRGCAHDYGIAEAWLHKAPDGTVTLAALVEYSDNQDYHAGPNRRFMAVTKRLARR